MSGAMIGGDPRNPTSARATPSQEMPGLQQGFGSILARLYNIGGRLEQMNDRFDPRPRPVEDAVKPSAGVPSYSNQLDRIDNIIARIGDELDALERRA